jgi:outer membrane protein TolC
LYANRKHRNIAGDDDFFMAIIVHNGFADRLKKVAWLAMLTAFFLLPSPHADALEPATADQQDAQTKAASTLTLDDVIELALRANRSVISSAYGVESQQLSQDIARAEFEWKFFPQITAGATDDTRRLGGGLTVEKRFAAGPVAGVSPELFRNMDSDDDQEYGSRLGLSLTIPLLRGFGTEINLSGVRNARYAVRSTLRSHYLVKVNTVLEAVAAAYNVVQQRQLVDLYQSQSERLHKYAVMAKAREKIGLATPIDVYRAEIQLKGAQDRLNRSQEALRNAGDRLKIVLATPLDQAIALEAPMVCEPLDISISQAVDTALQHRVELEQADDDIAEAQRISRVSKNNLYPQMDLVSQYTRLGGDDRFEGITRKSEDNWSVSLISTTDWSRKAEKAAHRQSLLSLKRVKLNRLTRMDTIQREVRQFYEALIKARERMEIRNGQIDQARGKLALAKIKFELGMADNFDLIEAETELQEARSNLLAARIDYIVGMYRLRAAVGTLVAS